MYPRLVLKFVDEEERAAPLPVAPWEAARTVDGRAPSLQDLLTWVLQSTLTISDMHSPVTRQGGTFWYRDCTLTVRKSKPATSPAIAVASGMYGQSGRAAPAACRTWQDVRGCGVLVPCWPCQGQQHMVVLGVQRADQLQDAEVSGKADGFGCRCPIEVHNAVNDWLGKYRKRQEQGQLGGRSHVKKEPGMEERTQPLWQQPGAEVKPEQSHRAARGSVKRPTQRTIIPDSPSKRRVPGSPGRASPMAMDTGTVITQLALGLQEVVRTALKEVLPDAVEKAIASGGKTRAERATERATKKEREARE